MGGMKLTSLAVLVCALYASTLPWQNSVAQIPATGGITFTASVKPPDGSPEAVRQISFYLLRKSVSDIRREAELADPGPDLVRFIDALEVSADLKAWMKSHQRIDLAGADFIRQLSSEDILDVPEFFEAYKLQNGSALHAVLPVPKYKKSDEQKNPEKFQRQRERYRQALRQYIEANRDTLDGLDAEFRETNPSRRWTRLQQEQQRRVERRVWQLAQTQYLVAKTTSDLKGRGEITGLVPGNYWITNLDTSALSGELRLRWDVPLTVHAAETVRVELSDLNALEVLDRSTR